MRVRTRRRALIVSPEPPEEGSAENPGPWHIVGSTGESAVFQNSWANVQPNILPPLAYRKAGDYIEWSGLIVGGAAGSVITTVPVGFRPVASVFPTAFAIRSDGVNNFFAGMTFNTSGELIAGVDHPSGYPVIAFPYSTRYPLTPSAITIP